MSVHFGQLDLPQRIEGLAGGDFFGHQGGAVEVGGVAGEALDAVVYGALGIDDEGPIGGLEEEELAAGAFHELFDGVVGSPGELVEELEHSAFGAVFDFPHPAGVVVDPDGVVALFAPGAFGESHGFVGHVVVEGLFGGHEFDFGVVCEGEDDIAEELWAFEPPVAEEFGVEGGDADALAVGGELVFAEDVLDGVDEVGGLFEDFAGDVVGVVGVFIAEAGFVVGDFPVSEAAVVVFLVEFEVLASAGVSDGAGPDLFGDSGVSAEGVNAGELGLGDDADGFEGVSPAAAGVPVELGFVDGMEGAMLDDAEGLGAGNGGSIDEEVGDAGVGDEEFEAWAIAGVVEKDGGDPVVPSGTVGAFREPHAAGFEAEAFLAGGDTGGDLGFDGLVVEQEGHVGVGGVGGEDLDVAFVAAFGEFAGDIAVDLFEAVEPFLVPGFPASGEEGEVEVIFVFEAFSVLGGAVAAFGEVGYETGFEAVVGELFEEDGSEADG